jgi:endonuclease I
VLFCNQEIRNYYTIESNTSLRFSLHNLIDDHTIIPYTSSSKSDVWDALKVLFNDANNSDNVILGYSRRSEPKDNSGLTSGWIREHLWCNSYGLDSQEPAYSDLFNLMPADWNVSSNRGNHYYDISDPYDSNYRVPGIDEAPLTSRDGDSWEPPDQIKGDVARAAFYMDLRYEGNSTNESDLILTDDTTLISSGSNRFGKLGTLLLWHEQDPVSDEERSRNQAIAANYQQNRNPFIDFPELAPALHDTSNHQLVFLSASYYTSNVSRDVTGLVNDEVTNGKIRMDIGNHTMGGDPEFGESKSFHALFAYEGKIHRLLLSEGEEINLPENLNGGGDSVGGGRTPLWNDTDLFYVKSHTQQDENGSDFRTYDFLLKSRDNFQNQVQTLSLPFGALASSVNTNHFVEEGAHYIFERRFPGHTELLTNYPFGFYNWNIGRSDLNNRVEHTVISSHADYPLLTPEIIGGQWENGKLLINPLNPVLQIRPWIGFDENDRIEWGYCSQGGGAGGATSSPGSSSIDFDWFGLNEGQDYLAYLFYINVVSEQENLDLYGDRYKARFGNVSALYFTMCVSSGGGGSGGDGNSSSNLEIIEAIYGASGGSNNVTSLLQSRVSNNQLFMQIRSSQLGGDPAFGEVKTLSVKYRYGAHTYRAFASEYDTLIIPNPNHEKVEPTLSEIMTDPARYGLVLLTDINQTLAQKWNEGFAAGVSSVQSNPSAYQLFTRDDLNQSALSALAIIESNRSHWIQTGNQQVTDSPESFSLVSRSDANASESAALNRGYIRGFSDGNQSVIENPGDHGLGSLLEFNATLTSSLNIEFDKGMEQGKGDVMSSPLSFGLMRIEDANTSLAQAIVTSFNDGLSSGVDKVVFNPKDFSLYTVGDMNQTANESHESGRYQGYQEALNEVRENPSMIGMIPQSWYFNLINRKKFLPYTNGWFYEPTMGWLFTQSSIFPYIFQSSSSNWLYFKAEDNTPSFYNYDTQQWFRLEASETEPGR